MIPRARQGDPTPRHALVVGCSSGIGYAVTRALLDDGWQVFGAARTAPLLAAPGFRFVRTDVADLESVQRLGAEVCRVLAGRPLDALIHCAAIQQPVGPLAQTDPLAWAHAIQVDLVGPYNVVHTFLPELHRSSDARILLFAGGGAFSPRPRYSAYACAKAGVVRLAETLAEELAGTTVSVNCVAPGFVPTPIHQATLEAGPGLAGAEYDRVVRDVAHDDGSQLRRVVACVRHLLSPAVRGLAGKTVAAQFDDWEGLTPDAVAAVMATELWTARRVNQVVPESAAPVVTRLQAAPAPVRTALPGRAGSRRALLRRAGRDPGAARAAIRSGS